jgi:predicted O-methyltransferase YrrM
MDPIDKIVGIVERATRGRLQLTPAEFDLFFADAAKEIARTIDEFVEDEFARGGD